MIFDERGVERFTAGSYITGICFSRTEAGEPAVMIGGLYPGPPADPSAPD
jgi:hypothetical protein